MALLTTTFSNVLNNRNYYARIYPVNPQGSMQSELYGQVTTDYVTPTDSISLSQLSEGSIVMIPENGVDTAFYVAKHDYESGLNGTGRVLMVRKDCYGTIVWNDTGSTTNVVNTYNACTYDTWLNNDYKSLLDSDVQENIGTTKFYYGVGGVSVKTITELERSVFALSLTELGLTHTYATVEGSALPIADNLKIAHKDDSVVSQWTRSPSHGSNVAALYVNASGAATVQAVYLTAQGSRPCFTLPSDMQLSKTPNADGSYNILTFPDEPSGYELIGTYTTSQEWVAPEDGWYQVEVFGASGSGGNSAINTSARRVYGGGGGGSGGYASSKVKLNKNDLVLIEIGAVGSDTTVTINPTTDELYDVMTVTSGANGGNSNGNSYGTGGIGGIASGGNIENLDGSSGGNGENVYGHTTPAQYTANGGVGGSPSHTDGNSGGTGAGRKMYVRYFSDDDQYVVDDNGVIAAGSGKAGFVKISRGNTNLS